MRRARHQPIHDGRPGRLDETRRLDLLKAGDLEVRASPAGLEYDQMTAGDIVVVDAGGRRPVVNAIVHTEPFYSNVFGVLGRPVEAVLINMVIYSRGPSAACRALPGPAACSQLCRAQPDLGALASQSAQSSPLRSAPIPGKGSATGPRQDSSGRTARVLVLRNPFPVLGERHVTSARTSARSSVTPFHHRW